ncbi:MAG: glycosyltransferase family 9 protein [Candidatus Margulisbacteria bacterium]|nr:glycosyltransferase family 9 protein [Candidatus Margulisiibacteriota bacterium]
MMLELKKILIIRPDELGDVILSLPLAVELKKQFPNVQIYYLCSEYTAQLLEYHPAVNGCIIDPLEKGRTYKGIFKFVKEIKQQNFDAVFHCYNEFAYALAVYLARIKFRVGDSSKLAPRFFHNYRARQDFTNIWNHEVDLNLNLLRALRLNVPQIGDFGMKLDFSKAENPLIKKAITIKNYIMVHPGLGKGNRFWGIIKYKALIDWLVDKDYGVIISGGASELQQNKEIAADYPGKVIDLTGKTSLIQLAFLIKGAEIFVSVDTGPMHLAAALGIPVVLISPSKYVKPNRWGPYGVKNKIVYAKRTCPLRCFPYNCIEKYCVDAIQIEQVANAIEQINREKAVSILEYKKQWLKVSLNILILSDKFINDKILKGFNVYYENDIKGAILKFIVNNDINLIIKNKISLWDKIICRIASLYIYYPPVVKTVLTENIID